MALDLRDHGDAEQLILYFVWLLKFDKDRQASASTDFPNGTVLTFAAVTSMLHRRKQRTSRRKRHESEDELPFSRDDQRADTCFSLHERSLSSIRR